MRARLNALRKGFASIFNTKKYTTKSSLECEPHMNELPVPCHPWDPWYKQKQSNYNKHLFFGLTWWLFSLGLAIYNDAFLFELWSPPFQPGPPSDMVDECEDVE